ncbi:unnamed protein product [Camellia sinensis]
MEQRWSLRKAQLHQQILKLWYVTCLLALGVRKYGLTMSLSMRHCVCPNHEMFVLEDAIGSTAVWPTHFISFDFQ